MGYRFSGAINSTPPRQAQKYISISGFNIVCNEIACFKYNDQSESLCIILKGNNKSINITVSKEEYRSIKEYLINDDIYIPPTKISKE